MTHGSHTLRRLCTTALLLSAGLSSSAAWAGVPGTVAHQGRLYDAAQSPMNGTIDVLFAVYDSPAATVPLWSELQTVTFDEGYYSAQLGTVVAFPPSLFDGSTRYFGMTVGTDPEMAPRSQIGSVPYALVAGDVVGDIHPSSISIPGFGQVIDAAGQWVGSPTGLQGPAGPAGPPGNDGMVGPTGPQGPAGADGAVGPAGPAGTPGLPGATGAQGAQGPVGATGAQGVQGPAGATGAQGVQGPAGATGAQGAQGPAGATGAQGPAGATGAQGPAGPAGPIGPMGPAGTSSWLDGAGVVSTTVSVGIGTSTPTAALDIRSGYMEDDRIFYQEYSVSTSTPATLLDRNGAALPTNFVGLYFCSVTGTNAPGTAVWLLKRWANGSVSVERLASFGSVDSNTPELFNNNGVPMIRLFTHPSTYTVRCRVERLI